MMKTKLINKIADFFIWANSADSKDVAEESMMTTFDLLLDRHSNIQPKKIEEIKKALTQDTFFNLNIGQKIVVDKKSQKVFISTPLLLGMLGKLSSVTEYETLEAWISLLNKIEDEYCVDEVLEEILKQFVELDSNSKITASNLFEQFRLFFSRKSHLWSDDLRTAEKWKPFYDICLKQMKEELDASSHSLGFMLLTMLPESMGIVYVNEVHSFIEKVGLEEMEEFFNRVDLDAFRTNEKLWTTLKTRAITEELKPAEKEEIFQYVYDKILQKSERLLLVEQLYKQDFAKGLTFVKENYVDFSDAYDTLYEVLIHNWDGISSDEREKIIRVLVQFINKLGSENLNDLIDKFIIDLIGNDVNARRMIINLYVEGVLKFIKVPMWRNNLEEILNKLSEEQGQPNSLLLLEFLLHKKSIISTTSERRDVKDSLLKILETSVDVAILAKCSDMIDKIKNWSWKDQKVQIDSIKELLKNDSRTDEVKGLLKEVLQKIDRNKK